MAEHLKSKSTGGFHQRDGSPFRKAQLLLNVLKSVLLATTDHPFDAEILVLSFSCLLTVLLPVRDLHAGRRPAQDGRDPALLRHLRPLRLQEEAGEATHTPRGQAVNLLTCVQAGFRASPGKHSAAI